MRTLLVLLGTTALLASEVGAGDLSLKSGVAYRVWQDGQRRFLPVPPAASGKRLALVIGNDQYPEIPLKNAVNDARAMQAALQSAGFKVSLAVNTNRQTLDDAITSFLDSVQPGNVALVYYSGHGIQLENENYLIPVDFTATTVAQARRQAYPASALLSDLQERGASLNILVLDACRDNPFHSSNSDKSLSHSRGLAEMDAGFGTYIAFATAPGRTASDNEVGVNGLFTGFLVDQLSQAGLTLDEVFNNVREKVAEKSNRAQVPWSATSVVGSFIFRSANLPPANPAAPQDPRKVLQHFETLFIEVEKNPFFDRAKLETSLAANKNFGKLHIKIVGEKANADAVLSVAATAITGYPFQLIHQETNSVLISGLGMGIWPRVPDGVAEVFVKSMMPYRKDATP